MFMTIEDAPNQEVKDKTALCVCGHMLYFHGEDELDCTEDDCTCEIFESPTQKVYCLDCEGPAMESCIRWHTTRENGVVTKAEEKVDREFQKLFHEAIPHINQLLKEKAVLLEAVKHALAVEMSTTQQQEKELRSGYVELLRNAIEVAEHE